MADNSPTNRGNELASNLAGMAIGLSILDALGDGGEVYARRNSTLFNNNFDAFGLPRNRFTLLQNIMPRQEESPMWGVDLRTILGANAEVYPSRGYNSSGDFGMGIMSMLFGNGIFGTIMGGVNNGISQEAQNLQRILAGDTADFVRTPPAAAGGTPPQPAAGNAGTSITSASGARIEEPLQTVTIPGEPGEEPAIVPAASTSRIASTTASASSSRVTPAAASTQPETVTIQRMLPADAPEGNGVACEAPKAEAPVKACTITRPKGPGGM